MKAPYVLAAAAAVFGAAAATEYFTINTVRYQVYSKKIPKNFDGMTILQLSDLHCTEHGSHSRRLIQKIDEVNPDIIVMTGDMVGRNTDISIFTALCRNLGRRYNTFYTLGNHELDLPDKDLMKLINSVEASGIHFLNNEKFSLISGDSSIELYGLWANLWYYKDEKGSYRNHRKFDYEEMYRLIGNSDTEKFNILLGHNPQWLNVYSEWKADLVFSGHIHGGVFRLPHIKGVISPDRTLFPKYDMGMFTKKDTTMIVSGGTGGIRFFNRPQIVVTELKSKQN